MNTHSHTCVLVDFLIPLTISSMLWNSLVTSLKLCNPCRTFRLTSGSQAFNHTKLIQYHLSTISHSDCKLNVNNSFQQSIIQLVYYIFNIRILKIKLANIGKIFFIDITSINLNDKTLLTTHFTLNAIYIHIYIRVCICVCVTLYVIFKKILFSFTLLTCHLLSLIKILQN